MVNSADNVHQCSFASDRETGAQAKRKASLQTMNLRLLLLIGLVGTTLLAAGCGTVKPWERGTLADYTMRADRDPLGEAFHEHIWFSREEASGGAGVGGGGCGCN
jgi:hypothetical protein